MFVRLIKKPNNRVSIRIVENNRIDGKVKQKIISGIGTAHEDDRNKIESLKRIAEQLIIKIKNEKDPVLPGLEEVVHSREKVKPESLEDDMVSVSHLKEELRLHKGVEDIFGSMFEQLNLFDSINSGYKRDCLLYTSPSPRDATLSRMPSSA